MLTTENFNEEIAKLEIGTKYISKPHELGEKLTYDCINYFNTINSVDVFYNDILLGEVVFHKNTTNIKYIKPNKNIPSLYLPTMITFLNTLLHKNYKLTKHGLAEYNNAYNIYEETGEIY